MHFHLTLHVWSVIFWFCINLLLSLSFEQHLYVLCLYFTLNKISYFLLLVLRAEWTELYQISHRHVALVVDEFTHLF